MKNSNKLLLGALALIVAGMIVANIYFKSKVEAIKDKSYDTEQITDSVSNNSEKNNIQIRIH